MAGTYEKTILIGYLGRDPEVRYMPSGDAVASFPVASNHTWKDKDGAQHDEATWWHCSAFGRLAETVGEYLRKGAYVYLEGRTRLREYTDRDGQRRPSLDLRVAELKMLDKRAVAEDGKAQDGAHDTLREAVAAANQPPSDDVPF